MKTAYEILKGCDIPELCVEEYEYFNDDDVIDVIWRDSFVFKFNKKEHGAIILRKLIQKRMHIRINMKEGISPSDTYEYGKFLECCKAIIPELKLFMRKEKLERIVG